MNEKQLRALTVAAAALGWLGLAAPDLRGQEPDPPADTMARLRGVVVLDGSAIPVPGAFVRLEGLDFATRTDSAGRFDLGRVPAGPQYLTLHHPLWQVRDLPAPSAVFSAAAGETTELEWLLPSPLLRGSEADPIPLEEIVATVYADVQRMRTDGSSLHYIGSEEIAPLRGTGRTVGDLVRDRVASLRTVPTGALGRECVQTRRMGEDGLQILHQRVNPAPDCPDQVAVIVDGMRAPDPSFFLATLSLDRVESVQFVPSSVAGARYGTGFAGGVLVIETR